MNKAADNQERNSNALDRIAGKKKWPVENADAKIGGGVYEPTAPTQGESLRGRESPGTSGEKAEESGLPEEKDTNSVLNQDERM